MERTFLETQLKEAGVAEEVIASLTESIIAEHGKSTQTLRTNWETAKKQLEGLEQGTPPSSGNPTNPQGTQQSSAANEQTPPDWTSVIDGLRKELEAERTQRLRLDVRNAVAGCAHNPDTLIRLLDLTKIKHNEDGTLCGLSEQIQALQKTDAILFKSADNKGTSNPPNFATGTRDETQFLGLQQQYAKQLAAAREAKSVVDQARIIREAAQHGIKLR